MELPSVTKILILGFDGLDYDLIQKRSFPHLKQIEYGKIVVPITKDVGEPSTPIVWASFITGKEPKKHGIVEPIAWNSSIIRWLQAKVAFIPACAPSLFLRRKVGEFLSNLGFSRGHPKKKHLKISTFFDKIEKSVAISVPAFDEDVLAKFGGLFGAIFDEEKRLDFLERLFRDYEETKELLFKALNKGWQLLMVHFQISDLYAHIYYKQREKILDLYEILDELTSQAKEKLDNDVWILVISDHGENEECGHNPFGFYSSNIKLGLTNPRITDFYGMFLETLGVRER